jgi:hypothetical protein
MIDTDVATPDPAEESEMRRSFSLALIFAFTILNLCPLALGAPTQDQQDQAGAASQQQPQSVDTQSARSFQGKILKSGDKFVLRDSVTKQAYQLDDQNKAKQFLGRWVKVTASTDPDTNMLHVVDIEPTDTLRK